jgi:hypothetical protein
MLNYSLETYFWCLTSIFIFCFGVRSPWRMTAMTHLSSILKWKKKSSQFSSKDFCCIKQIASNHLFKALLFHFKTFPMKSTTYNNWVLVLWNQLLKRITDAKEGNIKIINISFSLKMSESINSGIKVNGLWLLNCIKYLLCTITPLKIEISLNQNKIKLHQLLYLYICYILCMYKNQVIKLKLLEDKNAAS